MNLDAFAVLCEYYNTTNPLQLYTMSCVCTYGRQYFLRVYERLLSTLDLFPRATVYESTPKPGTIVRYTDGAISVVDVHDVLHGRQHEVRFVYHGDEHGYVMMHRRMCTRALGLKHGAFTVETFYVPTSGILTCNFWRLREYRMGVRVPFEIAAHGKNIEITAGADISFEVRRPYSDNPVVIVDNENIYPGRTFDETRRFDPKYWREIIMQVNDFIAERRAHDRSFPVFSSACCTVAYSCARSHNRYWRNTLLHNNGPVVTTISF